MVDNFESASSFEPGSDASTVVDRNVTDVKGGVHGSRAARLSFQLSPPTAEIPRCLQPWFVCARTICRDPGWIFLDDPIASTAYGSRCATRIRDPRTAPSGGTRRSEKRPRVAACRDSVSAVSDAVSGIDGRLNLDKARGIVFILDSGVAKPGTRGVLWIDDVGVY